MKVTKYIGLALLLALGCKGDFGYKGNLEFDLIGGCNHQESARKKEELKEISSNEEFIEIISNEKTGEKFKIEYRRQGNLLVSDLGEHIERFGGYIFRYTFGPGYMQTSLDGERIYFSNGTNLEGPIDSSQMKDCRDRFEKDKNLLRRAGILY